MHFMSLKQFAALDVIPRALRFEGMNTFEITCYVSQTSSKKHGQVQDLVGEAIRSLCSLVWAVIGISLYWCFSEARHSLRS